MITIFFAITILMSSITLRGVDRAAAISLSGVTIYSEATSYDTRGDIYFIVDCFMYLLLVLSLSKMMCSDYVEKVMVFCIGIMITDFVGWSMWHLYMDLYFVDMSALAIYLFIALAALGRGQGGFMGYNRRGVIF
jgi:hypothetical protein